MFKALCTILLLLPPGLYADMNLNVPFLEETPKIDGDLSEWKDLAHNDGLWDMRRIAESSFYTLDRGARNRLTDHGDEPHLSEDLSARYYIAWDDKNLYFGAEVNDNVNDLEDPVPVEDFDGHVLYDSRWYFKDAICWFMEGPRDAAKATTPSASRPVPSTHRKTLGGATAHLKRIISKSQSRHHPSTTP